MTQNTPKRRKHDGFFRYIYGKAQNTKALLQIAMIRNKKLKQMLKNVNLDSLTPIPGHYSNVGEQGEADLAFKAKSLSKGPDAFVGILLEHKSVKKEDIFAQIYRYVFEVMVNKSRSDFMWLPTKAIIIYNGKTEWDPISDLQKLNIGKFHGQDLPFECVMLNLADIHDTDCREADNAIAAIGALVMKHAFDPDGLRNASKILKSLLTRLDNNERATIIKKIELYLEWYIDQEMVKEMTMAFKSIGQRLGFVSIADAKRAAMTSGLRKGIKKGTKLGIEQGIKQGVKQGIEQGVKQGVKQEQANSEKKMKLFAKRLAKKFNISEEEVLALKP